MSGSAHPVTSRFALCHIKTYDSCSFIFQPPHSLLILNMREVFNILRNTLHILLCDYAMLRLYNWGDRDDDGEKKKKNNNNNNKSRTRRTRTRMRKRTERTTARTSMATTTKNKENKSKNKTKREERQEQEEEQ